MLCKAKCGSRMGTHGSSLHHLIARLVLLCCSFSISAWGKTRGKAGNSEQRPNTMRGCCMPHSLREGCALLPLLTTCPVLSLSLQEPSYAGTEAADHPARAAPGDSQGGLGEDVASPQQVWFGGLEGSTHGGGGECSLHACLHPWDSPHPISAWESAVQDAQGWAKLWALTWWKG